MRYHDSLLTCLPLTGLVARQNLDTDIPDQDVDELFPQEEMGTNALEDQGLSDWPGPRHTLRRREMPDPPSGFSSRLPGVCYNVTVGEDFVGDPFVARGCDPEEVTVYDVEYDDCEGNPWVICHCPNGDDDVERLATDFGQLPVKARDYVRSVTMSDRRLADGGGEFEAIALYTEGDIVIYGNWSSVGLMVHETTHILDYWVPEAGNGQDSFSNSDEWRDTVDGDTCVADWYSKSAYGEAYAQGAVLLAFDINRSGPLDDIVDADCAAGVHDLLEEQLGDYLRYNSDNTCGRRRFQYTGDVCFEEGTGNVAWCSDVGGGDDSEPAGGSGNNNNDDDDGNSNNNDDDDDESAAFAVRPLAIFGVAAQMFRFVGML